MMSFQRNDTLPSILIVWLFNELDFDLELFNLPGKQRHISPWNSTCTQKMVFWKRRSSKCTYTYIRFKRNYCILYNVIQRNWNFGAHVLFLVCKSAYLHIYVYMRQLIHDTSSASGPVGTSSERLRRAMKWSVAQTYAEFLCFDTRDFTEVSSRPCKLHQSTFGMLWTKLRDQKIKSVNIILRSIKNHYGIYIYCNISWVSLSHNSFN